MIEETISESDIELTPETFDTLAAALKAHAAKIAGEAAEPAAAPVVTTVAVQFVCVFDRDGQFWPAPVLLVPLPAPGDTPTELQAAVLQAYGARALYKMYFSDADTNDHPDDQLFQCWLKAEHEDTEREDVDDDDVKALMPDGFARATELSGELIILLRYAAQRDDRDTKASLTAPLDPVWSVTVVLRYDV